MAGEFEDRENGLGELPNFPGYSKEVPDRIPPGKAPPDILKQAEAYNDGKGEIGSPVIPASVTSVYDALPINARDFLHTGTDFIRQGNGLPEKTIMTLEYTIPQGFVGVWRGFRFEPPLFVAFTDTEKRAGDEINAVTVTLFIDNIIVSDYSNLVFGQSADIELSTFVVANAGQKFKLQLTVSAKVLSLVASGSDTASYRMEIFGNNLLTRGLPTPFEIATQNTSGSNL